MLQNSENIKLNTVESTPDSADLRTRIRVQLEKRGIQQGRLANRAGIHPVTLSAYLNRRIVTMRKDRMQRLERVVEDLEGMDKILSFPGKTTELMGLPARSDTVLDGLRAEILARIRGVNRPDPVLEGALKRMSETDLLRFYAICLAHTNDMPQ